MRKEMQGEINYFGLERAKILGLGQAMDS